jgi:hypothetical protein
MFFKVGRHSNLKRKKKRSHVYVADARYYFVIVVVRCVTPCTLVDVNVSEEPPSSTQCDGSSLID